MIKTMTAAMEFNDTMRHLVRIAAAIAGAADGVTRRVMTEANGNVDAVAVDEVLLQSYLFAGFPRALNSTAIWREISGIKAPTDDPLASALRTTEWMAAGDLACRRVYGPVYQTLRDNVRALHPALDMWMVVDGYGKVLSRPGLNLLIRELCIVAACAASGQIPQLRSHLRGAMNCGATHDNLVHTISALTDVISLDAMTAAREELSRVKEL
jgi:4-carboxymuconolactone decarboxylase